MACKGEIFRELFEILQCAYYNDTGGVGALNVEGDQHALGSWRN